MSEAKAQSAAGGAARSRGGKPRLEAEKRDGRAVFIASGDWLARTIDAVEAKVRDAGRERLGDAVSLDVSGVERIDTAGALLLERLKRDLSGDGGSVSLDGLDSRNEPLFTVVREALSKDRPEPEREKGNFVVDTLARLGGGVVGLKDELRGGLNIIGGAMIGAGSRLSGRTQTRPAAIFNQLDQMGIKAIPIIVLMSFLIGAIISQQGAFQLRRFGAEMFAVNLAGILVLRELGVVLTAIMIAGRSGSAITAEIGSMRMREEVDALHVIGLNPIGVLVFPRLVALVIALPLLTFVANFAGLLGSMMVLRIYSDISIGNFLQGVQSSVDLFTVFSGVIKAPFMAIVIGIVASSEGMRVGGSAESLGRHVTASVVKSIFLVILMDGLFAIFYASLGL